MIIGIPKEIKNHEYRAAMTPDGVHACIQHGHQVMVECHLGDQIGFNNEAYQAAGAQIVDDVAEIFTQSDMIVKVKEPQQSEYTKLKKDQVLFTYLHLAPDPLQTQGLLDSKCVAIAYETITNSQGQLPLLTPMSEVAGRMSVQAGANALEKTHGGSGVLLAGVPGVSPANVIIIGGGVAGENAARMALGLGANVTILDCSIKRLEQLDRQYGPHLKTLYSTTKALHALLKTADLVIGAVLIPGSKAPKVITKNMLKSMKPGSVLVDISIDQGGCFETSKPTTHQDPTYIVDGIVHYCVANMPGAFARTATMALTNATLPFVLSLADKGWKQALKDDVHLKQGLNVCQGKLTYKHVADALDINYVSADEFL